MFYQLGASIDPKIIGKSELPLTVQINDKIFTEQSRKYTLDINKYFEEFSDLYGNFQKTIKWKNVSKNKKANRFNEFYALLSNFEIYCFPLRKVS